MKTLKSTQSNLKSELNLILMREEHLPQFDSFSARPVASKLGLPEDGQGKIPYEHDHGKKHNLSDYLPMSAHSRQ
jgi:hypothetical protein